MKCFAALLLALAASPLLANCPDHAFTAPSQVALAGSSVMIVTHASSSFDARLASKRGVDEAIHFAKDHHIPLVYLQDDSSGRFYFMKDCNADYWVAANDGEIRFEVRPSHVYLVGGHLELCLSRTVNDIIYNWAHQPPHDLTVTYLMDGIYSNGKSIEESDPYYRDFERFLSIVTWGRPAGEYWPKLTLLEIMGVIADQNHEVDYLKKILPRYDRTMPAAYRIDLRLNDAPVQVLKPAAGWRPPTLHFEFVDSAVRYEDFVAAGQ